MDKNTIKLLAIFGIIISLHMIFSCLLWYQIKHFIYLDNFKIIFDYLLNPPRRLLNQFDFEF